MKFQWSCGPPLHIVPSLGRSGVVSDRQGGPIIQIWEQLILQEKSYFIWWSSGSNLVCKKIEFHLVVLWSTSSQSALLGQVWSCVCVIGMVVLWSIFGSNLCCKKSNFIWWSCGPPLHRVPSWGRSGVVCVIGKVVLWSSAASKVHCKKNLFSWYGSVVQLCKECYSGAHFELYV